MSPFQSGDTSERILDVAEDVFARYGYLASRIDDIAQQVGIRRPSLFHHFRNKETLFRAVLDRCIKRQGEYFRDILKNNNEQDPITDLEIMVDATIRFLIDNPRYAYMSLHTLASNQVEEVPTEAATVSMDYWENLLARGRNAGLFNNASVAECMALIGGMVTFYVAMPDSQTGTLSNIQKVDDDRIRTELLRLVKALLLTEQAKSTTTV